MNYFDIYFEGLALMHSRQMIGMAVNEGLLYPIHETAIQIMPSVSLEDVPSLFIH